MQITQILPLPNNHDNHNHLDDYSIGMVTPLQTDSYSPPLTLIQLNKLNDHISLKFVLTHNERRALIALLMLAGE